MSRRPYSTVASVLMGLDGFAHAGLRCDACAGKRHRCRRSKYISCEPSLWKIMIGQKSFGFCEIDNNIDGSMDAHPLKFVDRREWSDESQFFLRHMIILLTGKKHFRKVIVSRERRWSRHDWFKYWLWGGWDLGSRRKLWWRFGPRAWESPSATAVARCTGCASRRV